VQAMDAPSRGDLRLASRRPPVLRSVALPSEHGGWMLTLEPVLLGLLVAPSPAGLYLGLAAVVAFLARTPLKVALVDALRSQSLRRTQVAKRLAAFELAVLAGLLAAGLVLSTGPAWIPLLAAAPLVGIQLWFDIRSRSRRLPAELAGAVGVAGVTAMIVAASGAELRLAAALWMILAARSLTSVPHVRGLVGRVHGHSASRAELFAGDLAAVVLAALAVLVDPAVTAGAFTIAGVIALQRAVAARPRTPRAGGAVGGQQLVIGLTVILITGLGVLAP